MNVLVTGGAGYIGSVAVKEIIAKGHKVIVIDNLSKGLRKLVHEDADFYEVDLTDEKGVDKIFSENDIDAVIHFAAYKAVGESMEHADKYSDNITGTISLLKAMVKNNVKKIIFSSTAAVYGMPKEKVITEKTETIPINYYGFTKLTIENIISWFKRVHGINYVALRYFNVAGDGGLNYIDPNAENILPIIMEVVSGKRNKLTLFGEDYETRDGSCVRDYIHILDLVQAHILALESNYVGALNLGSGKGYSVKELINAVDEITGKKLPVDIGDKREGDPAELIANSNKAKEILGWVAMRTIKDMIESTLKAYEELNHL